MTIVFMTRPVFLLVSGTWAFRFPILCRMACITSSSSASSSTSLISILTVFENSLQAFSVAWETAFFRLSASLVFLQSSIRTFPNLVLVMTFIAWLANVHKTTTPTQHCPSAKSHQHSIQASSNINSSSTSTLQATRRQYQRHQENGTRFNSA